MRMIILGLTGSIAMGKSATAEMFRQLGVPVFDADAEVHQLYAKGGAAVRPVGELFPEAVKDGAIDRGALARAVLGDDEKMKILEAIVHPLVRRREEEFLARARDEGADIVVMDIPLLFETGRLDRVDKIVVVSAPAEIQRERALQRPGMTSEKFEAILARQIPDAEKRARADYVIDSAHGLDHAFGQVQSLVTSLQSNKLHGSLAGK